MTQLGEIRSKLYVIRYSFSQTRSENHAQTDKNAQFERCIFKRYDSISLNDQQHGMLYVISFTFFKNLDKCFYKRHYSEQTG